MKKWLPEYLWLFLFLCLSFILNSQLKDASNVHSDIGGHDEYLSVREVYSILHAPSLKHFVMATSNGDKLYYGRIMFCADAAVAWIPDKIWGVTGMVVAVRMTQSLVLGLALLLLSVTFIKDRRYRLVFLGILSLGTYTWYFIMMPKPEPYQLLFLALFFYYWRKGNYLPGKSFFWLGMAYGCKFNVLPLIPVFLGISLYHLYISADQIKKYGKLAAISLFCLLAGFITAIPGLILSVINPGIIREYVSQTFLFVAQKYDDPTVTPFSWLSKIYGFYFWGHNALILFFAALFLLSCFLCLRILKKTRKFEDQWILLITASAFFFPVILFTHRLWPHYLWTAHVLFVLLFIGWIQRQESSSGLNKLYTSGLLLSFAFFAISFIIKPAGKFFGLDDKYANECKNWHLMKAYVKPDANGEKEVWQSNLVWYPFGEFVRVDPYNPFSTPLQSANKQGILFRWNLTTETETIAREKASYLVINETNSDINLEGDLVSLKRTVGENWKRDTAFGSYTVYSRLKK